MRQPKDISPNKEELADVFRDRLARSAHLLRRCGWTDTGSGNTINVAH